ncbi:hypothetical protein [Nesterenkonia populi]|uniref:hypothetical protein n=1 Tax=Nesterenkonia populi TaxID=1591087 RepID=UPI0011BDB9D4|nr:hypothetical protein [Nesterenkonia populi]
MAWQQMRAGKELRPLDMDFRHNYAPTGGERFTEADVFRAREAVLAEMAGVALDESRRWDQEMSASLRKHFPLAPAEAGRGDTWDYIAFMVLPDLIVHRFDPTTSDRARFQGESRRHVLRRLWRRTQVFEERFYYGEDALSEDEFGNLLERQVTALRPALANTAARYILSSMLHGQDRRDFTRRLLKIMTYRTAIYWVDVKDEDILDNFVRDCAREAHPALAAR